MNEEKCKGDHSLHICDLVSQKKHDEIVNLAKNPEYMCIKCGRVANAEINLCFPVAFDEIPKLKKIHVSE